MKTVFTKERKTDKYYIQESDSWNFEVTCIQFDRVSRVYNRKAFKTLEKAKAYWESYFEYLDSVSDEF